MHNDKYFNFCSRIWNGREEALFRVLEDIPDRETWEGVLEMACATDHRLHLSLISFGLWQQSVDAPEDFPGQRYLAERRLKRLEAEQTG
jgi:hypothetical protein